MRKKTLVWVALVVVLALLGGGGYLGYRFWSSAREKAAVEAAAAFETALLEGDTAAAADALPPALSDELTDDDLQGLTARLSAVWELLDAEWGHGEYVASFSAKDAPDSLLDATFTLGGATLKTATVDVEYDLSASGDPGSEKATIDLVWQEGAWRVARYRFRGTDSVTFTFYRDGKDPADLADALREDLGTGATDGSTDTTGGSGTGGGSDLELLMTDPTMVVTTFYESVMAEDYQTAYAVLPADKRTSFGSEDAFGAQYAGYGITGYQFSDTRVDSSDGTYVLTVTATTVAGDFTWEWRIKKSGASYEAVSMQAVGTSSSPALTPDQMEQGQLPAGHPEIGGSD